jgi:hypothetical protein
MCISNDIPKIITYGKKNFKKRMFGMGVDRSLGTPPATGR